MLDMLDWSDAETSSKSYPSQAVHIFYTREDIISFLKKYISDIDTCHFYILGGSQFDLYNRYKITNKCDIDIFFPSEEDYHRMEKLLNNAFYEAQTTKFADTYLINGFDIQLINYKFGDVDYHFQKFDLNKSRIGFEYIGESDSIVEKIDDSFYDELSIDFINFNKATIMRYIKYFKRIYNISDLSIRDVANSHVVSEFLNNLKNAFTYLWTHKEDIIPNFYDDDSNKYSDTINGLYVLKRDVKNIIDKNIFQKEVIDIVLDILKDDSIIDQVSFWNIFSIGDVLYNIDLQNDIIMTNHTLLHDKISKEYKLKFPQYFI